MRFRSKALLAAALIATTLPAFAGPAAAGDLEILHPTSRATPKGAPTAVGYLTIRNKGATDRLVGATTPAVDHVEFHQMSMDGNVMKMRAISGGIAIPANGSVSLKSGGVHLMLIGLKQPFKAGDKVPLTLDFEKAGKMDVVLDVLPLGGSAPMDPSMPMQ
jgi:copper(I)-binding protein